MIWRDIVILKFKIGVISRKVVNVKNLEDCKTFLFFLFFFFFFAIVLLHRSSCLTVRIAR